jgi:hypothetical protein
MFESIIFKVTLSACFHNEKGIKMALLYSLRRLGKRFVSNNDEDAVQTILNTDNDDLLQLSMRITNTSLDVPDVCKLIIPVIESMSVPGTLLIKTFRGYNKDIHKEHIWEAFTDSNQKELSDEKLEH